MSLKDTFSQLIEQAFDSNIDNTVTGLSQEIAAIAKELRGTAQNDGERVWLESGPRQVAYIGEVENRDYRSEIIRRLQAEIQPTTSQPEAPSFVFTDEERELIRKYARDAYSQLASNYQEPEKLAGAQPSSLALEVARRLFPEDTPNFGQRVGIIRAMLGGGKKGKVNAYGFLVYREGKGRERKTYLSLPTEPTEKQEVPIWPLINAVVDRYQGKVGMSTLQEEVMQAGNLNRRVRSTIHLVMKRYGSAHGYEIRKEGGEDVVYRVGQNKADGQTAPYSRQTVLEILPDGTTARVMDPATRRDVLEGIRDRILR